MSYQVDILRGATVYSVSDGNPFWALSLTGLGLPPTRLLKERGPQQHGSTVVGFQLDERMLNLALLLKTSSKALAATSRDTLAEILKPVDNLPCIIRVTRDDGSIRQIDAYTVGVVDFPNTERERLPGTQLVVAQFEAPDPIPYSPTLQTITFDTSTGALFTIPMHVPWTTTTGQVIDKTSDLAYSGKWDVYPTIYATGPAANLVITNETTGDVLDFSGHTINAGVTYTIDLRYGFKTITDNSGVRQNSALTDASDLATWRIVPAPTAAAGLNSVHVEVASLANVNTQIRFEFYNRYPSID
jgi:hypothetical protein